MFDIQNRLNMTDIIIGDQNVWQLPFHSIKTFIIQLIVNSKPPAAFCSET